MILILSAALALAQQQAPVLPAGVSKDFQAHVIETEKRLDAQDYDGAAKILDIMPTMTLKLAWDDSKLDPAQRNEALQARFMAFQNWQRFMPNLKFDLQPSSPFRIAFVPKNPDRSDQGFPQGMALAWSDSGLAANIGISRGKPLVESVQADYQNDVARAIGTYLGVGELPLGVNAMVVVDQSMNRALMVPTQYCQMAIQNIAALDALRDAAKNHLRVAPLTSSISGPPDGFDIGTIKKGLKKDFSFKLSNKGQAPLKAFIRPECGCMTVAPQMDLAPGESRDVDVSFDSSDFLGKTDRIIYVVSNDPDNPTMTLHMSVFVMPTYRFLGKSPVIVADENSGTGDFYLTFNGVEPYGVKSVDIAGFNGDATWEDWEGSLPDPEMGEGTKARKGYHITVKTSSKLPPGRSPATLFVTTDSKEFPVLQFQVYAQKGIVASPDELFLGETKGPKSAKLQVSRPGREFKILSAECSSPNIKLTFKPGKDNEEWILDAEYDGKGPIGDYNPVITLRTDDPKQPTVKIQVIGTIQ
jgi:hypothetical protein